jgi:hypothetical protein
LIFIDNAFAAVCGPFFAVCICRSKDMIDPYFRKDPEKWKASDHIFWPYRYRTSHSYLHCFACKSSSSSPGWKGKSMEIFILLASSVLFLLFWFFGNKVMKS